MLKRHQPGFITLKPFRIRCADADKEHMATAEQVETLMEGLSMLDVHLQVLSCSTRFNLC